MSKSLAAILEKADDPQPIILKINRRSDERLNELREEIRLTCGNEPRVFCECGGEYNLHTKSSKLYHFKSYKHTKYLSEHGVTAPIKLLRGPVDPTMGMSKEELNAYYAKRKVKWQNHQYYMKRKNVK